MNDALLPADHPAQGSMGATQSPVDALCDAAVERLKTRLPPRVIVEHFPDKPEQYDFEGYDAAALVIYDASRFDREGQLGAQGLRETLRLVVVLMVRSLRGSNGAYELLHDIRTALHGQSLAGCTGLIPTEIALESEASGVFRYHAAFEGSLPAVPVKVSGVALPRGFAERR